MRLAKVDVSKGTEISLPVVVKRFEAVDCASERMARWHARHHRGFIELGREYPRADVSGHATSRCTHWRKGSTFFDRCLMVAIDFMVQRVLMRATQARKMLRFRQHKKVGAAGTVVQATFGKWR